MAKTIHLILSPDRDAVDVSARVLFDDSSARLKVVLPAGDQVDYEVPASVVRRGPTGEVPGARWARVHDKNGGMGFASDALYNFDSEHGEFRATVARCELQADSGDAFVAGIYDRRGKKGLGTVSFPIGKPASAADPTHVDKNPSVLGAMRNGTPVTDGEYHVYDLGLYDLPHSSIYGWVHDRRLVCGPVPLCQRAVSSVL